MATPVQVRHYPDRLAWLTQPNRDITVPFIDPKGSKSWWDKEGRPHRDGDLPSYIAYWGYKAWCVHGEHHRTVGPAKIWSDGRESEYWLHGEQVTLEEWSKNKDKVLQVLPRYKRPYLL